ncbi:helix-turn-helix domain-containing protein [Vibrio brasiliensis]|uniref:helix-turn-helix domain-containing protein n=1 Tax=Vibrio brasiliensis TaxID=170652 RepID=UPI001EFCF101|nr:XRE family transcriptional regulator [Vibrio brasiliensis]MCG9649186.1 XRE family transcriptional regulator [Vibrio brasiliensis]MCG9725300.1 XRE family transcriptional regulator [Vibrio brasiliensis]
MTMKKPPIAQIAATLSRERQRSGLSLSEVAKRAQIAKSTLSQLENGAGNPSIETLWSICVVLDIPFSRLIEEPSAETKVIRYGEGVSVFSKSEDYQATLLAACPPNASRDIYWLEVAPNEPFYSEPHNPGTIEHVVIIKGRARLGTTNDAHELSEGDYITYPGDRPHMFEALEPNTKAMLISEYR